jgi:hypothetical protein
MRQAYRVLAHYILGAILLFSADGCGDDNLVVFVGVGVSCSTVACFNVDETESFFADDGTERLFCTWFCADFDGFTGVFVELTFERAPGTCFELASEFISDGIC